MPDLSAIVAEIVAEMAAAPDQGVPASYIPPLAAVSPAKFDIAVIEADGTCHLSAIVADVPYSSGGGSSIAIDLLDGR
jgi:glutaminase